MRAALEQAHARVRAFAAWQRSTLQGGSTTLPGVAGVEVGQRLIPVDAVGAYAPGGRFSHLASAIMTLTTAKAAGVRSVVLCTPPPLTPAMAFAATLCGASAVAELGGCQAMAAMAHGLCGLPRCAMLIGPGNAYVAEAKRQVSLVAEPCVRAKSSTLTLLVSCLARSASMQLLARPISPLWRTRALMLSSSPLI